MNYMVSMAHGQAKHQFQLHLLDLSHFCCSFSRLFDHLLCLRSLCIWFPTAWELIQLLDAIGVPPFQDSPIKAKKKKDTNSEL